MAVVAFNKPIGRYLNEIDTMEEWRSFFESFFETLDVQFPTELGALNRSSRVLDGSDLDSLYQGGSYFCTGCANAPTANDGFLTSQVVYTGTPGEFRAAQTYIDVTTGASSTRSKVGAGAWTAWA